MSRQLTRSIALAALCVGVLGTRVYTAFERVRVRIVTAPQVADASSMRIGVPVHGRLSGERAALILRVQGASEATDLTVALDGNELARATVPAHQEVRIEASIDEVPDSPYTIALASPQRGWALTYLELASLPEFIEALGILTIVPGAQAPDRILPPWALLLLLAGLIALRPRPDWPDGRARQLHRLAAGLVLLLFAVSLLAHVFTRYGVLLTLPTFLLCAAVLYAEPLSRGWKRLRRFALEDVDRGPVAPVPGWREVLLVSAALTAVIAAVLHVQVANMFSVPDLGDPLFSIWRISWVVHQLTTDPRHLFDANIFYPARATLTYSDSIILPAITAMPLLRAGLHPVLVYNLVLLSGFVLSGAAMYLLARGLGLGGVAAWTSAVIFSLYPFRMDHYSHLELQMTHWMPLALLGVHRLMSTGGWRYAALTALAIGAQWYSSMYYALFLSVYVAVFALVLALAWRDWRRLGLVAGAVTLGACLALPLARAYSQAQDARGTRSVSDIQVYSATPADYLQPTHRSALYGTLGPRGRHPERDLFPGVAPVALAVAGVWPPLSATRMALLASGAVAFDGSLGMNGLSYPLLRGYLFPFESVRVPARFAILVGLSLALLSGAGIERWRTRGLRRLPAPLLTALVTALVAADAWPSLRLVPVWRHPPPIYEGLGPSSGAVLMEYPMSARPELFYENIPFLYFSSWHHTPMVNGYSGFISPGYARLARAMDRFPSGDTITRLAETGVTHISVICAIDGRVGAAGVPVGHQAKCDETIRQLDADPRLRSVVRARWEGAPALLYRIQHVAGSH